MSKFFLFLFLFFIFPVLVFLYSSCTLKKVDVPESRAKPDIPESKTLDNSTPVLKPGKLLQGDLNGPKKVDPELEKNRRLWEEKKIADYDFVASLYRFGMYRWAEPVRIQVRKGQAISTKRVNESDSSSIEGYSEVDTIKKIFDFIQRGLNGEADIGVKYDKNLGYPKDARVNYFKRGTDQNQAVIIKKFEIINQ